MRPIWSRQAARDLERLYVYVAENDSAAASALVQRVIEIVERQLSEMPHVGRPGRVPGTREFVIPRTPYIVPYRVRDESIDIIRVYHAARRWPDTL